MASLAHFYLIWGQRDSLIKIVNGSFQIARASLFCMVLNHTSVLETILQCNE